MQVVCDDKGRSGISLSDIPVPFMMLGCSELRHSHIPWPKSDSAYPCQRHLLTPFRDTGNLTQQQRRFNTRLSANRYIIEHTFGIIKQKFRQLFHVKLRSINVIVHLIRACCVLHNLAIDDDFPEEVADIDHVVNVDLQEEGDEPRGVDFRNHVMNDILLL
ncbi:hypothetical protein NQ315_002067 [Exocentrus adspersus]|uniref:DDE Tnp4 domain-containing protein n=1 Tax=Exocentrus adspersus TaxID=1586481 RepID=A0AAV8V304_9CUCU|nr:hypothetical protein NQ315_002067 [Exocentrus adspersus]